MVDPSPQAGDSVGRSLDDVSEFAIITESRKPWAVDPCNIPFLISELCEPDAPIATAHRDDISGTSADRIIRRLETWLNRDYPDLAADAPAIVEVKHQTDRTDSVAKSVCPIKAFFTVFESTLRTTHEKSEIVAILRKVSPTCRLA